MSFFLRRDGIEPESFFIFVFFFSTHVRCIEKTLFCISAKKKLKPVSVHPRKQRLENEPTERHEKGSFHPAGGKKIIVK